MVGIFIGIAAVVSLISLGQGLKDAVGQQFASIGTDKIIVQAASMGFGPPGTGAVSNLTDRDLKIVRGVSGVKSTSSRLIRSVKLEFHKKAIFIVAGSMPEDDTRHLVMDAVNTKPISGRMVEPGDTFKVTLGNGYATRKIFDRYLQVGDKVLINGYEMEVVGILEKTGHVGGGDTVAIINEKTMREILKINNLHDAIFAQVQNPLEVEKVVEDIERALRKSRDVKEGKEDFKVQSSTSLLASLDVILNIVQVVLVGIAAISLIVGGIGIMNTTYTSVIERTKEIGVMKAIGATNKDILMIFLLEAGLLGMTGGLIGIIIGMGLAKLVEIAALGAFGKSLIQASFPPYLLIGALLFSFVIGSISGLWPAMQASRLKPVDALRYE
ncbi:MAG: ABC transporter permease [Nanoarchaeota archaeon]